jgi:hypothetical protein
METLLEQGIIPFEFDYTLETNYNNGKIDWSALFYDDWNTLAFWLNKFPDGLLEQYPEMIDFAEDYAQTLKCWADQLNQNKEKITQLGYPNYLYRLWQYYFSYCEGGFRERAIGLSQMVLAKPLYRNRSLL